MKHQSPLLEGSKQHTHNFPFLEVDLAILVPVGIIYELQEMADKVGFHLNAG